VEEANEPKVEEPVVEEPKEPEVVEEPKQEEAPKVEEQPKTDPHLEELINSLKEEVEALKKMNSGLNSKIKNLEKEPSTQPISTNARPTNASGVGNPNYQAWRKQLEAMMIG
jgi:predicted RNase H-like nuclease (RuvC/YqgF family)